MASRRRLDQWFGFASHAVHHGCRRRRPILEVLEGRVVLSTFTVNGLGDARTGSGDSGDLRYCIDQANADGQANHIVFDPTVFGTPQTITLSGGQLELEDTWGMQTITGPAAGVTISAGGNSRVFQVDPGVTASISDLTMSGGSTSSGNGGGLANGGTVTLTDCTLSGNTSINGGGVYNYGTANLTGCTLSGNSAYVREAYGGGFGNGGGVSNDGSGNLTLTDCVLSGNSASYNGCVSNNGTANLTLTGCTVSGNSGSGVSNAYKCSLTLTDCTVSDNDGVGVGNGGTANLTDCTLSGNANSPNAGGGLTNRGTANLTDCLVSGNDASGGGGVWNSGTANLIDCTVSGNSALTYIIYSESFGGYGGGVFDSGAGNLALTDCTVSGNSASVAGGLNDGGSGTAALTDTIVAGNTNPSGASDIGGSKAGNVTGTYNLIGTGGSGGIANGVDGNIVLTSLTDLGLASLGNNGGPTQTMALLPDSAAIGAGVIADYPGTTIPITTDQRGDPLDSPNPDIGAFQTQGGSTLISLAFSGISSQSITYGASSVTISGTLANGSQAPVGETVAVTLDGVQQSATIQSGGAFSTTFTYDSSGLTVSDSPYTVNYAYLSDGKFASASTTSTLTVTQATLTIIANPETKVYGTADPTLAYTAVGFKFSDTAATVLAGALARAEAGTLAGEQARGYAITQGTLAADSNYTITFTGSTLKITPAPLTVTANLQTKVYGTSDPSLTDGVTGLVNTTVDGVAIDDTAATVLSGSLARAQARTMAGEQVGGYDITQGALTANSNYTIQFTGSTLTITPASLSVTASPQTKVYGTEDPSFADTATGFIDTTVDGVAIDDTAATVLSGSLARAQAGTLGGEQAGSYAIGQGTLAADTNYTITFAGSTLTITPAQLTVAANPQTKVYGTADPTLTFTPVGLVDATIDGVAINDTAATALTGALARAEARSLAGEQAGSYAIGQGTLTADSDYTIGFTGSTLKITPAPLSVTANPQTKVFGTDDPALTDTVSGLIDTTVGSVTIADTAASVLTGHLVRAAGETVAGAPYAITQGTLAADSNYTIHFTGSALTITPASLTVIANPQTKVYGAADPALTVTATGLVDTTVDGVTIDDTATTVLSGSLARAQAGTVAGEHAGSYAIAQGTLTADSNYTMSFTGSTLTIMPATLTVTANPQTKVYGTSDPSLTDTVTGLADTTVDGVTIDDTAATVLTGSLARAQAGSLAGEQAGSYAIGQGTLAADSNYTMQFTGSTLKITPAQLTVTANPQTEVYGTADPALTVTPVGLVDATIDGVAIDDTAATVLSGSLARAQAGTVAGEQVGSYAIAQGTLASLGNYTMSFTGGTLAITPATLTVTANSQTKVYGTSDPALTNSATGLVDTTVDGVTIDDTAATVLSGSLARAQAGILAGEQAGSYAITQGTLTADGNYTMSFTGGTLTITPATLTVTANPQTKVYGTADPALTVTPVGLVDATIDGVAINDTAATALSGSLARAQAGTVVGEQTGSYAITQGTLAADSNYTITFTGSTLTITPAVLNVTANPQTKVYGAPLPAFIFSYSGFVNGDSVSSLAEPPSASTAATASSPVGTYTITAGGAVDPNYTISYASGTLTVTPGVLTITVNNASRLYGQANPTFTASYAGLVNGDTSTSLSALPHFSTTAIKSSAAGTYPITASGAADPNYTINYVAGKLTVSPPRATVTSVEVEKVKSGNKTREVIEIRFSEALSATAAQKLGNYSLVTIPKSKRQTGKTVSLSSAAYSPTAHTVTLSTGKPLALSPPLDLTITAARLLDALGRPLAANYSATLSKVGVSVTPSVPLVRVGALSADAVDAVLAAGLRRGR